MASTSTSSNVPICRSHPVSVSGVVETSANTFMGSFHSFHRVTTVPTRFDPAPLLSLAMDGMAIAKQNTMDHCYVMKSRFIPATDNAGYTMYYEADHKILVGTTESFPGELNNNTALAGLGIVTSRTTIPDEATGKETLCFVMSHVDYQPEASANHSFEIEYRIRPTRNLEKSQNLIQLGRETLLACPIAPAVRTPYQKKWHPLEARSLQPAELHHEVAFCFVEKTRGAEIPLYECIACPGDRLLQLESIKRHRRLPTHKKNYVKWLACQNVASDFLSFIEDPGQPPEVQADTSDSFNLIEDMPDLDPDPETSDRDQRRQTLLDLWTKNHSRLFASPAASVHSSEHTDDHSRHTSDTEGCHSNDDRSDTAEDCSPHDHPPKGADNGSWAPFSSLEVPVHPSHPPVLHWS
ncbi:hypothetical protein DFH28DRAFT_922817 [Melampsora americana]|nr:hypothetical protein DFH28DRAFT_922817 [Melampsora americana]